MVFNRDENLALQAQRERLPIFKTRDAILHLVETRATTVLVGQTGCGKTTQVPQYLVEAGWTAGGRLVACTQPRRVAAMTVASRVADEMGVTLGAEVGYAVRFENVSTPGVTRVGFCTDGVLLQELMEDPLLSRYSVVMVDEAPRAFAGHGLTTRAPQEGAAATTGSPDHHRVRHDRAEVRLFSTHATSSPSPLRRRLR